ncbi:GNAT family N-acetyltransferase [Streptomyces albus subsp. chlorinus]|uniref:GNAT family N-acetyltransferase n=1 Tax=Streptomyces albus TaxID=1888 RepID=UPI00156DA31B|nr:GNAT family N-acetyltransferase [Streptomyces albus]NSC22207.1 GNAT family N-acetyltransferase [Streptomyces albus subsp. chlorinus]
MQIVPAPFDHPDARKLNDLVLQEYTQRYGDPEGDATPLAPAMFQPPRGLYLLAYDDHHRPVATGGWRAMDAGRGDRNAEGGEDEAGGAGSEGGDDNGDEVEDENYADGDAELKRMFVVPEARGRGLARRILAMLEDDARAAGRTRMVLETGVHQPEAIALYTSSGYVPAPEKFGLYRFHEESRCFVKPLRKDGW